MNNIQVIISARDEASKVFKQVQQNFNVYGKKISEVGRKMTSVGKKATMGLTLPLVGVGIGAIKTSANFDTLMRAAAQMNKGTGKSLDAMKKDIRDLSIKTIQDTDKMAGAFYNVGSAGFKGAEALEILNISGKAATGGLADVDAVTNTLVKSLSMFGMRGKDAGNVMDKLNGIVDTGIITFSQLASVFPTAASQAGALGVSLEEAGSALAVVTKKTGSAEEAATAINGVFTQLVKPTDALKEAIKDMGYENSQMAIEALGLGGVMKGLNKRVGGNVEVLGEMFGNVRAIRAMIPLLSDETHEYDETLKSVNKSQGRTNELFDDMVEGPGAKMKKAWIEIKIALAEFGDVMIPVISQLTEKLKILTARFRELSPKQKEMVIKLAALVAVIGPILIVLGSFISILGAVLSPIGLVVVAIGAFIAIAWKLYRDWDEVKESLRVIWEKIKEINIKVFNEIKEAVVGAVTKTIKAVVDAWMHLPENLGYALRIVGDTIWFKWEEIKNYLFVRVPEIINGIATWFARLPGRLSDILWWLVSVIVDIISQIPGKVMSAISGVKDAIIQPFKDAASWIRNWRLPNISGKFSQLKSDVGTISSAFSSRFWSGYNTRQFGGSIPETGPYILHKGEEVIPTRKVGKETSVIQNFSFNFAGAFIGDKERFKQEIMDLISRQTELFKLGAV